MTARETLEACREMAQECAKIAELIDIAERRIPMGPSASVTFRITDMPRGGNDSTAAAIARIDGLEEWYRRDYAEMYLLADEVEQIIVGFCDWEQKLIRAYYIDAKTDSEVALLMGWTRRATACEKRAEILLVIENNT